MDSDRFDHLTRTLVAPRSRRAIVAAVIGVALGAVSSPPAIVRANCQPETGPCPRNRHAVLEDGVCFCVCNRAGTGSVCCASERVCNDDTCATKGRCCPDERICISKSHGKVHKTCVPATNCCPTERDCPSGCADADGCCPNERACRKKVHGQVRTTCVPREQCCPGDEPCPADRTGCCNTIGGEQCAQVDGCCDVGGENKQVCAGKWCCDAGDDCDSAKGCVKLNPCLPGSETFCEFPHPQGSCCNKLLSEECTAIGCCPAGNTVPCGSICCPDGTSCCGGVLCRPPGWQCCTHGCGQDGNPCPPRQAAICAPLEDCCYINDAVGYICCPVGFHCSGGQCV